jgi:acetyl esterase
MTQTTGDTISEEHIDPAIARFADEVQAAYARYPDLARRPLAERRAVAEAVREPWRKGGPAMFRRVDDTAQTPEGPVRVRILQANPTQDAQPALIYAHGGGFTTFSLDTHDRLMREYAARSGAVVVGVDYALSPEAKFPTALNQIVGVVDWLGAQGKSLGIDPARLAIGGDSAGANLALAACLALRDRTPAGPKISAMLLNYGFFDADYTTPSQLRHGGPGKLLTSSELADFLENYLGGTPHGDNPLALPALAELHDLPPSFHVIAQCDPLSDGDRAMAARLLAAGNGVESRLYLGATHSFLEAVSISSIADQALAESSAWLSKALGLP